MKRMMICASVLFCFVIISASNGNTQLKSSVIDIVKLTNNDIPEGFIYGQIPEVYKPTLKNNPWMMDRAAIKRLADKIYPGGDANKIASMHVSIIANKKKPFGDDIVCYVILYKDARSARDELKKVTEFSGYNSDRCILLRRENLAVFLFVDNIHNFHYIRDMAVTLEERIKNL